MTSFDNGSLAHVATCPRPQATDAACDRCGPMPESLKFNRLEMSLAWESPLGILMASCHPVISYSGLLPDSIPSYSSRMWCLFHVENPDKRRPLQMAPP